MNAETIKTLKKDEDGKINIYFTLVSEAKLNSPQKASFIAQAMVENENDVIGLKESNSTDLKYAMQDIGFYLRDSGHPEHFNVSTKQYNELFGEGNWSKTWLEYEDYLKWKGKRGFVWDEDASLRKEETWKSTGHR
ncbi:hypothetical protein CW751_14465 [Brumimicrobium salinarum]|uniref:Uncharacterized protein n=1 Tax=Brumimicrobium salinarum TaxID=2058658 RepID=A0A2I0QZK5_9FLAO|nr:hypothetical protein [Brumimicrobium salinarum]PKR79550.1 hypothetical protein CW751_14465 [Brumimicrobium salinarum]